uniref:Uncharacterized protein n=1 Tax=Eptatretus burgeri TaxID=7764 RepID=A0A8C4QUU3_EPTBU
MQLREAINDKALLSPRLIPMFSFIVLGLSSATLYIWNNKINPQSWNKLPPNYPYKLLVVDIDQNNVKKDRPDF